MTSTIVDTAKEMSVDSGAEFTSWRIREFAAVWRGVKKPITRAMSIYIITGQFYFMSAKTFEK